MRRLLRAARRRAETRRSTTSAPRTATRRPRSTAHESKDDRRAQGRSRARSNKAWNVLSDPYQRGRYDEQRDASTATATTTTTTRTTTATRRSAPVARRRPRSRRRRARRQRERAAPTARRRAEADGHAARGHALPDDRAPRFIAMVHRPRGAARAVRRAASSSVAPLDEVAAPAPIVRPGQRR